MATKLFIINNLKVGAVQNASKTAAVAVFVKRDLHDVVKGQYDNLAAYRRGKGGRASFSGIVATVFGASGFVGRYVVNQLGKIGSQVICPYRADPYYMKDLKLSGDMGQILFLPYHLRDEDSIKKAMKYSNVVINLVGRDWETKNFTFDAVNNEGACRIARLAREAGVERFIHVSHVNAQLAPPSFFVKGGSQYLISKQKGEEAVRAEFPDATIIRPADIFGLEDRFLRYYMNHYRRSLGYVPLWKRGMETIKRPVFVSDVARGIVAAAQKEEAVGETYEFVGPKAYYLCDIVDYIYRCLRFTNMKRGPVTPYFKMKVRYMTLMPTYPILTMDKLDREHVSDILQDYARLEDLGVKLTTLESQTPYELYPFREDAYYEESVGEFPYPEPPPAVDF